MVCKKKTVVHDFSKLKNLGIETCVITKGFNFVLSFHSKNRITKLIFNSEQARQVFKKYLNLF